MLVRTMKPLRLAFSMAALLASGCTALLGDFAVGAGSGAGTDAAADITTPRDDGAMPASEGGGAVDGGPLPEGGGDAAAPMTVSGHVVDEASNFSQPIASRKITIVDANGTRTDVTSDASGAFTVSGVVPPYDAVVAAGSIAGANPFAFLAVSTSHPRLFAWPDAFPSGSSAIVKVVVQKPACDSSSCRIDFASYDCSSGDDVSIRAPYSYSAPTTQTVAVPVSWSSSSPEACRDFNVLVSDATHTHFWYGQVGVSNLANGSAVTTSTVTPTPIPTIGSVTVSVTESPLIPAAWGAPNLDVFLIYPSTNGNGSVDLAEASGSTSLLSGVPNIVGATLTVQGAVGSDFHSSMPDPNLSQMVLAVANGLPLSTSTVSLALGPPLSLSAPTENGSLSASTGAFAWTWGSPGEVMDATFVAVGDGSTTPEVEVWTGGTTIDLSRLAKAGVTLEPSQQGATLQGRGKVASLDAMLDEGTLAQPDGSQSVLTRIGFTLAP